MSKCAALMSLFTVKPTGEGMLQNTMSKRPWRPQTADGCDETRFIPSRQRLFRDLYFSKQSPYGAYSSFTPRERARYSTIYPSSAQRSGGVIRSKVLAALGSHPEVVVEVGSFIGSGAINVWGKLANEGRAPSQHSRLVLCVDPWQGDLIMRLDGEENAKVDKIFGTDIRGGYSHLVETFMRRVLTENLSDTIYPVAIPSLSGARFLYMLGYKLDIVYVDSAHERGETAAELLLWYDVLRPGGLLMGDDLYGFPAVAHDVMLVTRCLNLTLDTFGRGRNQWMIQKPLKGAANDRCSQQSGEGTFGSPSP